MLAFVAVGGDFATNENLVGLIGKFVDEGLFVVDFGATDNEKKGFGRMVNGGGEIGDFFA